MTLWFIARGYRVQKPGRNHERIEAGFPLPEVMAGGSGHVGRVERGGLVVNVDAARAVG